jgi:hypothetical protein
MFQVKIYAMIMVTLMLMHGDQHRHVMYTVLIFLFFFLIYHFYFFWNDVFGAF